ncbi:DUF3293 domain-containing protein [Paeniroseomonas aquatica]|uniref:DUF3293 domain-containing protein n=1 Tax=Paeniroseomonas aquatica TaxID=373043 RepID=A0ABT8ABT7_9PROT|nr:DUF3293 domain-containing protein [Paeniroseomonas aquatica]MDN3567041.1 DUF3293 domain-containing protein [Paeniroseomonas aquatica]
MSDRLLAAYRRSTYEAAGAVARIGRRSAAVDVLLARLGVRAGGFVTAWNPFSHRRPDGWNARMLQRLATATRRLPSAPGQGGAGRWREAHLLVGADPRRLLVLARRFRQAAIVTVARGQPARLRLLRYR